MIVGALGRLGEIASLHAANPPGCDWLVGFTTIHDRLHVARGLVGLEIAFFICYLGTLGSQ
jgi:hypothetical protein